VKRFVLALLIVTLATMSVILATAASSGPKPEYELGFKALADQIPEVVGEPLEYEHWGANGDSLQQTTTGLMVWRKADNWTAFTNGSRTWINGPAAVQDRSNVELFSWESPASGPQAPPTPAAASSQGVLQVHVIDVGQGDSILIQGPDGRSTLIDGGSSGTGVLQYLQRIGVKHLDLVVATHPHEDHIGGLPEILNAIPTAKVATGGQPSTTRAYERFLDAISTAKAEYVDVKRGDTLQVGPLAFQVLNPPSKAVPQNLNNASVVLRLVWGSTAFMLQGDAEKEAEADILASGKPVSATILKIGHHGSRTSSSPAWLKAVGPLVAVYSAGAGNSYGHPHGETLAALAGAGVQVHGTDTEGTVVITSDGSGYSVATAKTNAPRAPPENTSPSIPAVVPVQPPTTQSGSEAALQIVSVTSPARRGGTATLTAKASPGAQCSITVRYKSGPSTAAGLVPKSAGPDGMVSWSWNVGPSTTPGTWPIAVTCGSATADSAFMVQ